MSDISLPDAHVARLQDALTATTSAAREQLRIVDDGVLEVSDPVLHLDSSSPATAKITGPDGSLELRLDRATGQPSVHLISPGFPQHGTSDPIDTQLGVNLGATVIDVPDADLDKAVHAAASVLAEAQRHLDREHDAIRALADDPSHRAGDVVSAEPDPSAQYADIAERNANLAINGAASTATPADDGDAAAARVAALGARGAAMSGASGSLDPHKATQVAVAASTRTRQRLREVHDMVDQVAAQRPATPAAHSSSNGTGAPVVAPRYADRTDYVSPCVDTTAPTVQQG